jgi:hypothetical protein
MSNQDAERDEIKDETHELQDDDNDVEEEEEDIDFDDDEDNEDNEDEDKEEIIDPEPDKPN